MRRKKLANQITGILMAGLMVASAPMSVLAEEAGTLDTEWIEAQADAADDEVVDEDNAPVENAADETDAAGEAQEGLTLEGIEEFTGEIPAAVVADAADAEDGTTEEAPAAKVAVTISNQGVLAKANDDKPMVQREVTVTDLNHDGVLTYDEALVAAHEAYNTADGYKTEEYTSAYGSGISVIKLWGEETSNIYFYKNGKSLTSHVGDTATSTVKDGDDLYTAILKDGTYSSDLYATFDSMKKEVKAGEEFTLTLTAGEAAAAGVQIGTWNTGSFAALDGKTTGDDGKVTLSFDAAGTYYVTANGTVKGTVTTDWSTGATQEMDCPIMAPYCVVTVAENENAKPYLTTLNMRLQGSSDYVEVNYSEAEKAYICFVKAGYSKYVNFRAMLSEDVPQNSKVKLNYVDAMSGEEKYKEAKPTNSRASVTASGIVKEGMDEANCTLIVGVEGNEQVYPIKIQRLPEIKSVTLSTEDGSPLREMNGQYYVAENQKDKLYVKADAYGNAVKINGETVTVNEPHLVVPVYDSNKEFKIEILATGNADNNAKESYSIKYFGQNDAISGICGENTKWELTNGTLKIGGNGNTDNWYTNKKAPWGAFSDLIKSVQIEEGVTGIGTWAFYNYPEISQVSFPSSLLHIEKGAFSGCTKLESLTFSTGLEYIGDNVFDGCTSLKVVILPEKLNEMGENVFKDCTSLEAVKTDILGYASFNGCSSLKNVTLKEGITNIPSYAFSDCTSLESITIPEGVISIENGAFSGCTNLKNVVLPKSLEELNGSAFENCPSLEINGDRFNTVDGIVYSKDGKTLVLCTTSKAGNIKIPDGVTTINANAFSNCKNITEVQMPDSVTTIGTSAFSGCSSLEKVTLPTQLKNIPDRMFEKCIALKEITIPEAVNEIGKDAFVSCEKLEKITLPQKMDKIGENAFWRCLSLKECIIPDGVTEIPSMTFSKDNQLEKIVFPESITKINNYAFDETNVKYVLFKGTKEKWNEVTGTQFASKAKVLFRCSSIGDMENAPVIEQQPKELEYNVGEEATNGLRVKVQKLQENEGFYYFTWYKSNSKDTNSGTEIVGTMLEDGITSSCTPDTSKEENAYYYCMIVKVDADGAATWTYSDIVTVSVSKGLFEGTGSEKTPYLLYNADDLGKVRDLVNAGNSMDSIYFKFAADITLPKDWTPIGATKDGSNDIKRGENLNAFSGIIDGNNKTITVPEDGLPLLGYVKGAEVHNLNIFGTKINGYGLVNNLEGVGLEGTAIIIDHVTLKAGSKTLKAGLIGANITTSAYSGCSAGFVTIIRNCTIEKGCEIGYQKDQRMIGSLAGRIQGTIENCVSYATVYGVDYVGGIVGTRDNAMGSCKVENCTFDGTVEASGTHVGGIVGGGYNNSTAPNGIHMSINQCTAAGSVTGADKVGGILGGDSYVAQAWNGYTMKGNAFTGTVKATEGSYIGGIIGFYLSLNKYDDIAHNSYRADCGAEKGIGFVKYIDTNNESHETESGTIYINTENSVANCPEVTGCAWREAHNRTDDPLGADAASLTSTGAIETYVTRLEISGTYKTEYYLLENLDLTGMVIKAFYSDGTEKELSEKDVTITGFDNTTRGEQTITVTYEGARTEFKIKMKKEAGKVMITFQLLGDTLHDEKGTVHTLAGGNLTSWIPATTYTVDENDSVYEILLKIAEKTGFTMLTRGSQYGTYIYGVEYNGVKLEEFDNGKNSGWMYTVNGEHPNVGVDEKYLSEGDIVVLHYTDDYTREEGNPHVHSWGSGVITKAPTCTEAGIRTYTCECGETKTESVPAIGHKYGAWTTTTEATVFAPAVQTRTCTVCGNKETQKVGSALKPTIKVNATTIPLKVKQTTKAFKVSGLANGDSVKSYKSSNTKIFTVTKNGVLKAGKKTGKATLTITLASGLKKKVTVKVQKKTVATTKITGLQKKLTMKKGGKLTLKPSIAPITSTQKITYKSSNKKIATVSSKGVIKAKKTGKVKITVKSFTVTVTVKKK